VLTNTVFKVQNSNQENAFVYVCDIIQGIDLAHTDLLHQLKWIPDESEREGLCTKEMK